MTTNIKKESKEEVLDKKFIENSLKTLGRRFGVNEAFRDVVTCIAYSFANVVDMKEEREKEYLRIINKYEEDERNLFSKILVALVNENKEQLLNEGGIATANSIKDEIKKELEYNDYFYEYQKDSIVHTIAAKNFDNEMIDRFASLVFDIVDWQCTSSYIAETDWAEEIERYYKEKLNESELEI